MDWKTIAARDVQAFIKAHEKDDVAALGLKKSPDASWDYPLVLAQIKARQKALQKIPAWRNAGLIFPATNLVEQASSQATALYKASLVQGTRFADLTAGMGVDGWAFAQKFKGGFCIEKDAVSAEILAHNFTSLGLEHIRIVHDDCLNFLNRADENAYDVIYLDPQRRDGAQKGKYRLEQCEPNILQLLPLLKTKARLVMLKTSPMLDIVETLRVLGCVNAVHVLEYKKDCKEVVYCMAPGRESAIDSIEINAAALDETGRAIQNFSFTVGQEKNTRADFAMPLKYLYEPGPAFQKAGGYNSMAARYNLHKLHPSTHLYSSGALCADFPGRVFEIQSIHRFNDEEMRLERANITLRNFPGTAEDLRKKLRLKDGGDDTLFACTLMDETKVLIHARPVFH